MKINISMSYIKYYNKYCNIKKKYFIFIFYNN